MNARRFLTLCLSLLLVVPAGPSGFSKKPETTLNDALKTSYLDLFELAKYPHFTSSEIAAMRDQLARAEEMCLRSFKQKSAQYDKEIELAQKRLKDDKHLSDAERHDLHCRIQNLRALKAEADVLIKHGIPVAYDNRNAKLDLIERWPASFAAIARDLETGTYRDRRWGDVQDIGFREIEKDQAKDIQDGLEAIREMKAAGVMPREIENKEIVDYVTRVGQRIASNSDLKVPLQITLLDSQEINAFALPGGYLFLERGLLESVDDESELAGVIAHEISHVVVRHGHKLMLRARIANIFLQIAEVAAVLLSSGTAFAYYGIQYGFYGVSLALDLRLLGVSRDFELEADQLGIQYAWNSGYDPSGFIRFFDKMATTKGYIEGTSWFYDHPPFYDRMVHAQREIAFLPQKSELTVQTSRFDDMKKVLMDVTAKALEIQKGKPSLLAREEGCPVPARSQTQAEQPIETICGEVPESR